MAGYAIQPLTSCVSGHSDLGDICFNCLFIKHIFIVAENIVNNYEQ